MTSSTVDRRDEAAQVSPRKIEILLCFPGFSGRCCLTPSVLFDAFTTFATARDALEGIARDFDAAMLSGDDARRVVEDLGVIRRLTDGMLAKAAKRISERSSKSENATETIAASLGVSPGEVRAAIGTATELEKLPATDAAVRAGRLSPGQAKLIADAATKNPDAEGELLAAAELGLVPLKDACIRARAKVEDPDARRKRHQRSRELRMWTDADGMVAGRFRLAPQIGAQVKNAIDAQVQRLFRTHKVGEHEPHNAYAADALAAFVLNPTEPGAAKDPNATVHVIIDHAALIRGNTIDGETCEIPGVGPVDVTWVRELIGSAFLTAIVKRGKDILTVAHLGRHVPAEIQTALVVSGRECGIEGCYHRGYLERDHTYDHAKGGPTAFWNLAWLCYLRHRLKTAGWILGPLNPTTGKRTLTPP